MAVITRHRWQELSPYLDHALDLPPADRESWVASLGLENAALADEVRMLMGDQEAASRDGFLAGGLASRPAVSVAGHRIGAYTLVSLIGRGGMGTVWLAQRSDGRFDGNVAIKLLNLGSIGPSAEARFTREGSILARLRHEHIAHLVDAGVSAMAQPYLVLEHVEGNHIDEYCDHHNLGVDARVQLFLDVLDAVAHAHANLIVHRDIKPSNVLVRTDGQVKLLDFGIAKLIDADSQVMSATGMEGRALTPEYAAPEQLTGGPITTATDVYALGILLYVLLGGRRPAAARGRSAAELIRSIVETDLPRLSTVAPAGKALRGDLDTIVAKALKKVPEERYASAAAMADDLRRYLRHEPVIARPDTFAYRTAKFLRRRRGAVAVAAGVILVIASLVGFYTARLGSERDRARLEADKSARISELLTSLLTGADPYATHDREPTVRHILDAGAERVAKELRDQPDVKAEMMTVIGRIYQRLGLHDKAAPLLDEAAALGRASGRPTVQLARSLNDLGVLSRERGDAVHATPLLEEALAMRRSVLGNTDKFAYLGSAESVFHFVLLTRKDAALSNLEKLRGTPRVRVAAGPVGHSTYYLPRVFAYLIGMKEPRIVPGYSGSETEVALVAGEVDLSVESTGSVKPEWIQKGLVDFHVALEIPRGRKFPGFTQLPDLERFVKTAKDRQLLAMVRAFRQTGAPWILPPNTPKERVQTLQEAMRKTFADPEFHSEYKKIAGDDPTPLLPEELEKVIRELPRDPEVVELFKKFLGGGPLPSR
jgi:serine/threonine-protein kinase